MRDWGFVPRLLLARDLRENDEAPLSPAQTHYLRRVLRLREGDAARVFDGEGRGARGDNRRRQARLES